MKDKLKSCLDICLRIHDRLSEWSCFLGAILLSAIAVCIVYEVLVRYAFKSPTEWVMDFSEYAIVYATFLSVPWILKIKGHVSVRVVVERLGNKSRLWVDAFTSLVGAAVSATIAYQGIIDTWVAFERGVLIVRPILIPEYLVIWVILIGMASLCLYFIRNFFSNLQSLLTRQLNNVHSDHTIANN